MPRPKAPAGQGSIKQRKDGLWAGEIMFGYDANGKRRRFRCTGKTQREVRDKIRDAIKREGAGTLATGPQKSVKAYLEMWLEDVVKPGVFSRTYIGYEELIRLHALPAIGKKQLQSLGPADLQRLYSLKLQTLSPQRVLHLHRCLHRALEIAVRWDLIPKNPADLVDAPKVSRRDRRTFTPGEARTFMLAARGNLHEALFVVAICTAMRQGELLGLKWRDVDLETGVISLQRAVSRVRGVGLVEKAPKSGKGRSVPLILLAVSALRKHKTRQKEQRLKAGAHWQDNDLVFPNTTGSVQNEGNLVKRYYYPLLEQAGLPHIRFHDLRHSAATLLLALHTDLKTVSAILGHSSISITADLYAHAVPALEAEAMGKWQDLLSGERG